MKIKNVKLAVAMAALMLFALQVLAVDTTPAIVPPIIFQSGPVKGATYNPGDYMQIEGCDQMGWNQYNALNDLPW
jgi:hypothetical protein